MKLFSFLAGAALLLRPASAVPAPPPAAESEKAESQGLRVTATAPAGTVVGRSLLGVETFNGIPFAEPPTGNNRLKPPVRLNETLEDFDARGIAAACPQMFISTESQNFIIDAIGKLLTIPLLEPITGQEDCLTVSVQRPAGTKPDDKLPVLFWIFGGGFQLGASNMYDATPLINNGVDRDQPFVYVAVNYRVGGFGFMPGSEVLEDGAANLGLRDQRMGLQWVADNIGAFGGDPEKVTIWGESAGAISVLDQMVLHGGDNEYNGNPLFRGAIMNSGTIAPAEEIDSAKGQAVYDGVVESAGCEGEDDTLQCLRELDYRDFLNAANSVPGILSYESVALSYLPRPDGRVLADSPDVMVSKGQYAAVPMITGNQEDEGTLFALFAPNVTTTDRLVGWLSDLLFHGASQEQLRELVDTYPASPSQGSPFRTGILNILYPGFKRFAAVLGDLVFTLTRRAFLAFAKEQNPDVRAWSYLASYNYGTPILGTFHGSDLIQVFYGLLPNYASRSFHAYYTNFVHNLDPNVGPGGDAEEDFMEWPEWEADDPQLLWVFNDRAELLDDDFRPESFEFIVDNVNALRARDGDSSAPRWGF